MDSGIDVYGGIIMIVRPKMDEADFVPPRPDVFALLGRLWFAILDAVVWCLTLSKGQVVRRHVRTILKMPPIY